jgi:hypothetical protein
LSANHKIDGLYFIKYGSMKHLNIDKIVESCTKGDWNSRFTHIISIFPSLEVHFKSNLCDLEKIRKLRNQVGHSFGRDIEESRQNIIKATLPQSRLDDVHFTKYHNMIDTIIKNVDESLLNEHIGMFQYLNYLHTIYKELPQKCHSNQKAVYFRDYIGKTNVSPVGRDMAREIVKYYESV